MSFARLGKTSLRLRYFSRRLGGVSSHASSSTTACPRCGFAPQPPPPPPRGNSFLCPTPINNAFCDPLKLAKNIPPPAATRVVTQSPPIEFDSLFHSVSQSVGPISRQNPSLVTTLVPYVPLPSHRVGSLSRTLRLLVFSEHTYRRHGMAFQYLWHCFRAGVTSKLKCPKRSKLAPHLCISKSFLRPPNLLMRPNSNSAPGMINSWWPQGLDIGP